MTESLMLGEEFTSYSHSMMQEALTGKEYTNAPILQHYLRAEKDNEDLLQSVDECRNIVNGCQSVLENLDQLRHIDLCANLDPPQSTDELEDPYEAREAAMYPHLLAILNAIAQATGSARSFVESHKGAAIVDHDSPALFTHFQPGLVMLPGAPQTVKDRLLWREVIAFIEVKLTVGDGPISKSHSTDPNGVKPIVAQAGDCARLHMALRPFQVFSIYMMIYGPRFTVSVYDRGGVLHSKEMFVYDSEGVTRDFICTVRQLCKLSEHQLGRDYTATLMDSAPGSVPDSYPTFRVRLHQSSRPGNVEPWSATWQTEGPALWQSYSLLGRGTAVWMTHEYTGGQRGTAQRSPGTNRCFIIKNAWRRTSCTPESDIYSMLKDRGLLVQRGIAEFYHGGDVTWQDPNDPTTVTKRLTVNSLRPATARLDPASDIVLHRVVLSSIGKPLWEYDSIEHLVRGLQDIVAGLEALEAQGIRHGDLNPGNLLLYDKPDIAGKYGFITDFEFTKVRVRLEDEPLEGRRVPSEDCPGPIERSQSRPEITGSIQFLAFAKLVAIGWKYTIHDEVSHDLESVFWVILYSLYQRIWRRIDPNCPAAARAELKSHLCNLYGQAKIQEIFGARQMYLSQASLGTSDNALPGLTGYKDVLTPTIFDFVYYYAMLIRAQDLRAPAYRNKEVEEYADLSRVLESTGSSITFKKVKGLLNFVVADLKLNIP